MPIFLDTPVLISAALYPREKQFLVGDFFSASVACAIDGIRLTLQCYRTSHRKVCTKIKDSGIGQLIAEP